MDQSERKETYLFYGSELRRKKSRSRAIAIVMALTFFAGFCVGAGTAFIVVGKIEKKWFHQAPVKVS